MNKEAYKAEFKKVFSSLAANYPHLYKAVDFDALAVDWYEFFVEVGLPPNLVQKCYREVIRYKVETGNDFGAVSTLDMLSAFRRISAASQGTKKKVQCEICNGELYTYVYNLDKQKDELKKCPNIH